MTLGLHARGAPQLRSRFQPSSAGRADDLGSAGFGHLRPSYACTGAQLSRRQTLREVGAATETGTIIQL
jgi:hypothetical protein